mmetsp:Transcript_22505/g.33562  ORF Transcript_22505/g.33562 Transcript_22505/m.33562 type:complete len:648 (+) Transcript_22505:127-2070(+)
MAENRLNFLAGHLLNLFNKGEGCDVHFRLDDGEVIGAHKLILHSVEFFRVMLGSGFMEGNSNAPIRIEGVTSKELKLAFRFIYTGVLNPPEDHMAMRLLWLSQMWQFETLQQASVEWAIDHLNPSSCIHTFVNVSNVLLASPSPVSPRPSLKGDSKSEGKPKTMIETFMKRFWSFIRAMSSREFRHMIIRHAHELKELRELESLEAFAKVVGARAYHEEASRVSDSKSSGSGSNTNANGGILSALFDAIVAFHRAKSPAHFIKNGLYCLLGPKGNPVTRKRRWIEENAVSNHEFCLQITPDFKERSTKSFEIGPCTDAIFYLDCQLETSERYQGWYGVYLCPDWPECLPDTPLSFQNLPALVSFKLNMTAKDINWQYCSDPIVFHGTDTGWGQRMAIKSTRLRKSKSAVLTCRARSSAVFRLVMGHLYRNFENIDPEVLAGLDARTLRSIICTRWPAHKAGLTARRLQAFCRMLSKKSGEWVALRSKLEKRESELKAVREELAQARGETSDGISQVILEGLIEFHESSEEQKGTDEKVAMVSDTKETKKETRDTKLNIKTVPQEYESKQRTLIIKLPFGVAYIPRQAPLSVSPNSQKLGISSQIDRRLSIPKSSSDLERKLASRLSRSSSSNTEVPREIIRPLDAPE